jgi:hypothetical protein
MTYSRQTGPKSETPGPTILLNSPGTPCLPAPSKKSTGAQLGGRKRQLTWCTIICHVPTGTSFSQRVIVWEGFTAMDCCMRVAHLLVTTSSPVPKRISARLAGVEWSELILSGRSLPTASSISRKRVEIIVSRVPLSNGTMCVGSARRVLDKKWTSSPLTNASAKPKMGVEPQ